MKDFFDLLADFLASDLAKNYAWLFIVCIIMIIVITGTVVWLYASKIYYKIQNNEMQNTKEMNEKLNIRVSDLGNQNKDLVEENDRLRKQLQFTEFGTMVMMDSKSELDDPAMSRFVKKD